MACVFLELSQQPTFPHIRQMRRFTQVSPIARHALHESGEEGVTSRIRSMWGQGFADRKILASFFQNGIIRTRAGVARKAAPRSEQLRSPGSAAFVPLSSLFDPAHGDRRTRIGTVTMHRREGRSQGIQIVPRSALRGAPVATCLVCCKHALAVILKSSHTARSPLASQE